MNDERPNFYDLSLNELETLLSTWGIPAYRARQIWTAIYGQFIPSPEGITTLPLELRARLGTALRFESLSPARVLASSDQQTQKTLFTLPDQSSIEAVLMVYDRRRTTCISTQAGCAMGCSFCATGQMGFFRSLTSGEIIEQVLYYARHLQQQDERLTNIVLMGMGEPFANYDAVLDAITRLNDPQGANIGERRFTISTVGIVPGIYRFAEEKRQINLAVSLHAATDEVRNELIPINRRYPLDELFTACHYYVDTTSRRITFEWALIQDVNDGLEQADALIERLRGLICHVNLIPLNPTGAFPGLAPAPQRISAFQARLEENHIPCTLRLRRGVDIQAGCGQLASLEQGDSYPSTPAGPTPDSTS